MSAEQPTSRRTFMSLAGACGLLGSIGCGYSAREEDPQATPDRGNMDRTLDKQHLALGLSGLSTAHAEGWAFGHYGAAVIASAYFRAENPLDERTDRAVREQVEAFVRSRPKRFPAPDPGPGSAEPARIAERLAESVGTLRSGGHDAIYSSLALRALCDLPEFATPRIVDGIGKLLEVFTSKMRPEEVSDYQREHPLPPYAGAGDVVDVTLRALLRPWTDVMQSGAGNVVHWVTHADALLTLEELGYADLARGGYEAHQQYVNQPAASAGAPEAASEPERAASDWLGAEYWESDAPRTVQDTTWFFGHSFKLPYSLFRLLRRIDDLPRREACLLRASRLSIPFE